MKKNYLIELTKIKFAIKHKHKVCYIRNYFYLQKILKIFIKYNLVKTFKKNTKIIKITLTYKNNQPVLKNIIYIWKPTKKQTINYTTLNKLKKNTLFFIENSNGILSLQECLKKKLGGLLLLKILL